MTSTYKMIAKTTLGSPAASYTFSSITGAYTDLVLISYVDGTSAGASVNIRFNSDIGSNYSYTSLYGDGSNRTSTRGSSLTASYIAGFVAPNTALETVIITNIQNYSNATTNKTFISRSNRATANNSPGVEALVGLWRNTSAITSIILAPDTGNFDTGTTFTLYGIKAE
jgi:hypothetical protein